MFKMYIKGNAVDYNITTLADGIMAAITLNNLLDWSIDIVSGLTGEILFSIGENEVHVSNDIRYAP